MPTCMECRLEFFRSRTIVPLQFHPHECAAAKVKAFPVIVIKRKSSIGARIDGECQRPIDLLAGELLERTHWNDGSGADIEGKCVKVHVAGNFPAAIALCVGPKVKPCTMWQIERAACGSLCDDRSDKDISSIQVFISAGDGRWIIRIMQPQRAYDRKACLACFLHILLEMQSRTVAQFEVFSADRFNFRIVQFRLRGMITGRLWIAQFARVPSPRPM